MTTPGAIGVHAANPHYFEYRGKEILLITSAEHYGAVISKKFDYIKYFDKLAKYGLNYTRIYPGAFVECPGKWMPEDNMAPGADLIVPWARSNTPGYRGGGNKFDLSRWEGEYFARLRDFIEQAEKRGVIVELCFFNCEYGDFVEYSPLHVDANIQGVGGTDPNEFQTTDNALLFAEQLRYVEKLIVETNGYGNVIYEFIDEPTLFLTPTRKAYEWIDALITKAVAVEEALPNKHMLAQQLELGIDFCDDERISVITTQYIGIGARQVGGVPALDNCYCYNKPIELNETFYMNSWKKDNLVSVSRLEAWEFIVGGGAGFNQLNGFYTVQTPSGDCEANDAVLNGLKNLRAFVESFDYIKMTRDTETVRGVSIGARVNAMSEKGKRYAMYMHHSFPCVGDYCGTYYEPNYGRYSPEFTLRLPAGTYAATFIDPETYIEIGAETFAASGGDIRLQFPEYELDVAVKIIRVG